MIRIYNGGIVFSTEVLEKKRRVLITVHTLFNCQEEIQQLVCWPEELDDKWSLNSANFSRCRSCDFTDLNTTTGKQIPRRDWFS